MQTDRDGPLMLLMGGFLNQDWSFAYPSIWAAVDDFIQDESREDVQLAASELRDVFLNRHMTEDQLHQELAAYACAYFPPGQGQTYREWLIELEQRLSNT